jgi:hypothetical protein
LGPGVVTLWRTRRVEGNPAVALSAPGTIRVASAVAAMMVVLPIGQSYIDTHALRAAVARNHLGVPYEDAPFRTSDGLELEGW